MEIVRFIGRVVLGFFNAIGHVGSIIIEARQLQADFEAKRIIERTQNKIVAKSW